MKPVTIRIENLGKRYFIGKREKSYKALRDIITESFVSPFRKIGHLLRGHASGASALHEEIWALRNITLEIRQGEAVGIIGRNGAGKSTLLKVLSRITEPAEGGIDLYGRVGSLLEVGTGFHPELTGRDNIYLNGAILGMKKNEIQRKFDEIVSFSEVEKFIDTPVKHYSSGMYLRLAFAVAAHLEPEILLVDEVLAVGDASFQKKCLGRMGDVAKSGRTVMFVSHNITAIQNFCDRAIWLDHGEIKGDGAADEIALQYLKAWALSPTETERVWSEQDRAPGNSDISIRRLFIQPASSAPGLPMAFDQKIEIGVDFQTLKKNQDLDFTFIIITDTGVVVCSTSSIHSRGGQDTSGIEGLDLGLYCACCLIPPDFFNHARYLVRLIVVRNKNQAIFTMEEALEFEILDAPSRRTAYYGKRPGVVAPKFHWKIEPIK
ncbi:MAG: hypothetical protein B6244_11320 [Candidatus Cloacimonetes bacterium 4572_55]|nr:MAG: hypothetical protein B6244_11320 [Candidatus Cloacimonetes bacterium 4572_55]